MRRPEPGVALFDFLSWGHLLVIALAALFIFGPERLPTLSRDAARGLARARQAVTTVRQEMQAQFGEDLPDLREVDLRRYHPRTFLREQLFDEQPPPGTSWGRATGTAEGPAPAVVPVDPPSGPRLLPPPFDPEAT